MNSIEEEAKAIRENVRVNIAQTAKDNIEDIIKTQENIVRGDIITFEYDRTGKIKSVYAR